jgi:hypothetical protein
MAGEGNRDRALRLGVLASILAAFLILATYYNVTNPLFESPDELEHTAYAVWLADVGTLPVLDAEQPGPLGQESAQAPLYYWLVARLLGWIPHRGAEHLAADNPQANIGVPLNPGNKNRVLHDPAQEGWPYRETALFVHMARGFSTMLALGTLGAIYRLGRITFPDRAGMAMAMTALVAFTPQFLYLSSTLSNDNLVILLSSWVLVMLAAWLRGPVLPGWWQVAGMGLLLGLAVLAKLSGVLLWPLVGGVLLWLAWRARDAGWLVKAGLVCFVVALAVCGWWLARNQVLYGDITASQVLAQALGGARQGLPTRLADIVDEFRGFRYSLWALFGWFNILAPQPFYWVVDGLTLAALAGLVLYAVRSWGHEPPGRRAILAMLLAWLGLVAAGTLRWAILISSQGRLAYPALGAAALFLVVGWAELVPQRLRRAVGVACLGAWAVWAALCPALIIGPAYERPERLAASEAAAQVAHEVGATFGEQVTLLGYELDRESVVPGEGLWLKACWQGEGDIRTDYFVFVQLLVENDLIAGQRDTYHGLGSFPTSHWPAGLVFCDGYPLEVADTVPAPGAAEVSLGLYGPGGQRLLMTGTGADQVRLPGPEIAFPAEGRVLDYDWDRQVALVDYELERTALAPGERLGLALTWSAREPIETDYAATVQVLDATGTKVGQSDVWLGTSGWEAREPVVDLHEIAISPEAAPGVYRLVLAVYDPQTVANLALYHQGRLEPSSGLLELWTVRVVGE